MLYGMISLAAGVVLLLASELAGVTALRIVAVALMAGGIAGIGIAAGLGAQAQLLERSARVFSRTAVCVIAVLLATPMLTVLAAALLGASTQVFKSHNSLNTPLVIAGGALVLLLLAVTLMALTVGIAAIRGKTAGAHAEKQA